MKIRTWPYGTKKLVRVEVSHEKVIVVTDDTEAWVLLGQKFDRLPEIGSIGNIVFTKGGPTGGYWKFEE